MPVNVGGADSTHSRLPKRTSALFSIGAASASEVSGSLKPQKLTSPTRYKCFSMISPSVGLLQCSSGSLGGPGAVPVNASAYGCLGNDGFRRHAVQNSPHVVEGEHAPSPPSVGR